MILTAAERAFLDVFLHEATTSPFSGPATTALHAIGVYYSDISHIAWAYGHDVPRAQFEIERAASLSPPVPWSDRDSVLGRDREIERLWSKGRAKVETA